MKRGRKRLVIGGVLAVVAVAAGVAFASRSRGPAAVKDETPLGKAAVTDVQVEVTEIGTVEPEIKVDVKSALSGKVAELPIREGDTVRKGELLASIEPDVNQAQTLAAVRRSVNQEEIAFSDADNDYKAKLELLKAGLLSQETFRTAETRFRSTQESLAAAREKASIVESSGIPLSTNPQQLLNITSPMDGVVITRAVEYGEAVTGAGSFNAGTVIATVADLAKMIVKVGVSEVDIGKLRLAAPVTVTLDAYPKLRFAGKVSRIAPAARLADQVKVFDVEVTLKEQVPDFRAGMTANIEVRGDKVAKALSVPSEGVFKKNDREIVYVLKKAFDDPKPGEKNPRKTKSGKYDVSDVWQRFFDEREVKVGLASLEKAQILEGLADGTQVALEDPTRPRQINED